MFCWHVATDPQPALQGSAGRAFGTITRNRRDEQSKPSGRRRD